MEARNEGVLGGQAIEIDTKVAGPMHDSFYQGDSMRSRGTVWLNPTSLNRTHLWR